MASPFKGNRLSLEKKKAWIFPSLEFHCCLQLVVNSFLSFLPLPLERVGTTRGKARLCRVYKRWRRGIENNGMRGGAFEGREKQSGKERERKKKGWVCICIAPWDRRGGDVRRRRTRVFLELNWQREMWDIYDFLSHCFLPPNLSSEAGGRARPTSAPLHLFFFGRGWQGCYRKEGHWFPFCWISNDPLAILFYLLSLANGILRFFYSIRGSILISQNWRSDALL